MRPVLAASRKLAFAAVLAASSFAVLTGCSGSPRGVDLVTPDPDPVDPDPTPDPPRECSVPTIMPKGCDGSDTRYATEDACRDSGSSYCYSRPGGPGCVGDPPPPPFWCGQPMAQCLAMPVCDAGDKTVTACPGLVGTRCYSRTMCGTTIQCLHEDTNCKALPTCDAGDEQVSSVDQCSKPGVSCYSRTACSFTIWCARS